MKAPLFNSLGSNYSFHDAVKALGYFFAPIHSAREDLEKYFVELYPNFQPTLVYKGRDALELALRKLGVGVGDVVLTQAFSCYAVEEAIVRCGAVPWFFDVAQRRLVPDTGTLEASWRRHQESPLKDKPIKAIISQHTLGDTSAYSFIHEWSRQKGILHVADLAQAFGTKNEGVPLGSNADAIILSFGRDKVWDEVTGGAVLVPPSVSENIKIVEPILEKVSQSDRFRDALYPLLTLSIRILHPLYLGRLLHAISKTGSLLYSPILTLYKKPTQMPLSTASFVLWRLASVDSDLHHRKSMAKQYFGSLSEKALVDASAIETGANLRFPVYVENVEQTIADCVKKGIYIADRWYRAPVDVGNTHYVSLYQAGTCPNAEELANHCLNLPTHRMVTSAYVSEITKALSV